MASNSTARRPRRTNSIAGDELCAGRLTSASSVQVLLDLSRRRAGSVRLTWLLLPLAARFVLWLGALSRPIAVCPHFGLESHLGRADSLGPVPYAGNGVFEFGVAGFGVLQFLVKYYFGRLGS